MALIFNLNFDYRDIMEHILSYNSKYVENPLREFDARSRYLKEHGKEIIKLSIGDPAIYFPTADYIIKAYSAALKERKTYYSRSEGVKELINAIIKRYKHYYSIGLHEEDVIVTSGVSEALLFINSGLINKGDSALFFKPYYSQFIPNALMFGAVPIYGEYDEKNNWGIDTDRLEILLKKLPLQRRKKLKYMMLANPSNPTGTVLKEGTLRKLVDIANEYGMLLISDEIYDEIVYNGAKFTSMSKIAKGIPHIVLSGLSKNFSATGLRIGFMIMPEQDPVSEQVKKKMRDYAYLRLSINTPAQYAAAEAIGNQKEHDRFIKDYVSKIESRVNSAYKLLSQSKYLQVVKPNGAFYIFPKYDANKLNFKNDAELAHQLLETQGVQITRGSGFGKQNHFRIVCLAPESVLEKAITKIDILLDRYKKKTDNKD